MTTLKNKVAIITGASSGIGYATAKLFAKRGAKVVLAARRRKVLDTLVEEIAREQGQAIALAGDINDENYAESLVHLAIRQYGGLDIAFNNAGMLGSMGPSTSITSEQWLETINTNLTSAFYGAKYQIAAMLERGAGSVIFTSSFVGYTVGFPELAAYSASKAGLVGLCQSLAVEYAASKVRVNALLPGGTDTPMGRTFTNTAEAREFVKGLHALKRIAVPEEIAHSALYLASDASSFTTGTAMLVDGGISVCRT